ncbi:MAG TPA: Rieske 2Fe-2S domain-containing protein [Caldimonas sp.]|jgi:nitrite reductase/ring-hydroxylating ferredoxin subunit|nr:Rieske 2Fe-2S domain-containing protein [Caldimonas sp.]HEV7576385.1 Rieske 2Fe-2S domain-containing protein [Caldimonas sp.]
MADWQRAAALDDVWGDTVIAAKAGAVALVLVRSGEGTADDRVCAYRDACPHEKFPLSEWGQIENGVIVCQRHFWEFDVATGKHITRIERPNCNLVGFAVKVEGGDVLVDVDSALQPAPTAAPEPPGP